MNARTLLSKSLLLTIIITAAMFDGLGTQAAQGQPPYRGPDMYPVAEMQRLANELAVADRERELDRQRDGKKERYRELNAKAAGRHLRDLNFVKNPQSLAFGSDGKQLFCGLDDGTVRIMDVESGNQVAAAQFAEYSISDLAVSSDGRRLLAGCEWGGAVYSWDLLAKKLPTEIKLAKPWGIEKIEFSRNGNFVAAAGISGTYNYEGYLGQTFVEKMVDPQVYIYDARTGKLLRSVRCEWKNLFNTSFVALSPDGMNFVVKAPSRVDLWRCERNRFPLDPVAIFDANDHSHFAFSPDGKSFAAIVQSRDSVFMHTYALRLFDATTGKNVSEHELAHTGGHSRFFQAPVYSPSGNSVACEMIEPNGADDHGPGHYDDFYLRTLSIVNLKTSRRFYLPRSAFECNSFTEVDSLCFSSDGSRLAGIVRGNNMDRPTVRVWDVPSD
jgi:WD40 repeat protein